VQNVDAKVQQQLAKKEVGPHRPTGTHDTRAVILETLWRVFYENNGPRVLQDPDARSATHKGVYKALVPVSQIRFSHDRISDRFSNGDHKGASVEDLIAELRDGVADPLQDSRLILRVVEFAGEKVSLNNRRLYALRMHQLEQEHVGKVVNVRTIIFPLDPVTAKFILSYTTQNGGLEVVKQIAAAPPDFI